MTPPLVIPLEPAPDPVDVLRAFRDHDRATLLHSSDSVHEIGRYSYFSADPVAVIEATADEWPEIRARIRGSLRDGRVADPALPPFQGGWMGWFSYELGRAFDSMACAPTNELEVPDVALGLYDWVIAWDHGSGRAWLVSSGAGRDGGVDASRARKRADLVVAQLAERHRRDDLPSSPDGPLSVDGDFSPRSYRAAVARVIEHVRAGDIFQANIAQRFLVAFSGDPVELYAILARRNPAPMAAFVVRDGLHVVSASPERFLRYDPVSRSVETRPIKGTRPRGGNEDADAQLAAALLASEKDRAENVMIVDLLRNDLSRVAEPASVQVTALCRLEHHPTVHHLVSIVSATLRHGHDVLDLLAATFPPGSVTGAPKLRAMQVIAAQEPVRRGVYCGAIGWIGLDGAMDSSVAIRTVTLDGRVASLHAGGGITARSDPAAEHDETIDKARALLAALAEAR